MIKSPAQSKSICTEEAKQSHESPPGQKRSPQAGNGAAAVSNGGNSQGANLVQTRLNVIDGEIINSRQSHRSLNNPESMADTDMKVSIAAVATLVPFNCQLSGSLFFPFNNWL